VALHHKKEIKFAMQRERFQIFETDGNICPNWHHAVVMSLSTLLRFASELNFDVRSASGYAERPQFESPAIPCPNCGSRLRNNLTTR
jgi:hypothetical protein